MAKNNFNTFANKSTHDVVKEAMGTKSGSGAVATKTDDDMDDGPARPAVPEGGTFHEMRIGAAKNGYTVRTTHKVPSKKGKDGNGPYVDGDGMAEHNQEHVFNHPRQLVDHVLKMCK